MLRFLTESANDRVVAPAFTSKKTDYQRLQENNITLPTFYYHVEQLRKKAYEIPSRNGVCKNEVQEVILLIIEEGKGVSQTLLEPMQMHFIFLWKTSQYLEGTIF